MVTSLHIDPVSSAKPARTRKLHHKVKTGCLTCKIRRKKCDENRPACERCTSTGRKCDGYPGDRVWPNNDVKASGEDNNLGSRTNVRASSESSLQGSEISSLTHTSLNLSQALTTRKTCVPQPGTDAFPPSFQALFSNASIPRNPSQLYFSTDREHYSFTFFRDRTGQEFAGYFGSSIWSNVALQSCIYDPAIQQALVAIGAAHRRMELGITPEAFEYCEFALRSYTKALNHFNKGLLSGDAKSREQSLIVPILLCVFEVFQGNIEEAKQHMGGWLKILLSRQFKQLQVSSVRSFTVLDEESLRKFFHRLETQCMGLFHGPAVIREGVLSDLDETTVPTPINTLEQARDTLFTMVFYFMQSLDQLEPGHALSLKDRQRYGFCLLQWSCAHAEYAKSHRSQATPTMNKASSLLRIYRHAACLLLLIHSKDHIATNAATPFQNILEPKIISNPPGTTQSRRESQDVYNAHFARLIARADLFLEKSGTDSGTSEQLRPWLVIDSGTSSLLDITSDPARRSTNLRNLLASMVADNKSSDGGSGKIWETMGAYSIAEKMAALEEGCLLSFVAAATTASEQRFRALSMDVVIYMEERKLLTRYCVPDSTDGSLVWTQEWMAF